MKRIIFAILITWMPWVCASESKIHLLKAPINLTDTASLQRGAKLFALKCQVCHSLKYMRYQRVADDLGWSKEEVVKYLGFGQVKPTQMMLNQLNGQKAEEIFGTVPPDLTLMTGLKGSDYVYTFLNSFYYTSTNNKPNYFDPTSQGKWSNHLLEGTSMPAVMAHDQANMSEADFKKMTADITNFLTYATDPARAKREALGIWVILFLGVLLVFAYLLKKEYWKDVE